MKKFIVAFLAGFFIYTCLSQIAHADDMSFETGLGVFNSGKHSLSETKILKLSYEQDIWYSLKHRVNGGFWLDNVGNGRNSSGFASYQLGFDVKNQTLEAAIYVGPGYITTPDVYLGGHFQFNETLFLGVSDNMGNAVGVAYNHFSSAGLETPNIGRDFLGAEIKFPF